MVRPAAAGCHIKDGGEAAAAFCNEESASLT